MSVNLTTLTIAALVNGLNPCGIGMMITFLGYLLVFGFKKSKDSRSLYLNGGLYITSVFVTYLLLGLFFYGLAFYLQRWWLASVFKYVLAGGMFIVGLIQIKDAFWEHLPVHLQMSSKGYERINLLMAKSGKWMAVVVGVLTTMFSTPCMLPVYVGTTSYLARSGMPMWQVLVLFLYYNFVFILPLLVILIIMIGGNRVVEMKEWQHRNTKWLRVCMAVVLFVVGYILIK